MLHYDEILGEKIILDDACCSESSIKFVNRFRLFWPNKESEVVLHQSFLESAINHNRTKEQQKELKNSFILEKNLTKFSSCTWLRLLTLASIKILIVSLEQYDCTINN